MIAYARGGGDPPLVLLVHLEAHPSEPTDNHLRPFLPYKSLCLSSCIFVFSVSPW